MVYFQCLPQLPFGWNVATHCIFTCFMRCIWLANWFCILMEKLRKVDMGLYTCWRVSMFLDSFLSAICLPCQPKLFHLSCDFYSLWNEETLFHPSAKLFAVLQRPQREFPLMPVHQRKHHQLCVHRRKLGLVVQMKTSQVIVNWIHTRSWHSNKKNGSEVTVFCLGCLIDFMPISSLR